MLSLLQRVSPRRWALTGVSAGLWGELAVDSDHGGATPALDCIPARGTHISAGQDTCPLGFWSLADEVDTVHSPLYRATRCYALRSVVHSISVDFGHLPDETISEIIKHTITNISKQVFLSNHPPSDSSRISMIRLLLETLSKPLSVITS